MPLFVIEGTGKKEDIAHLPDVHRLSIDLIVEKAKEAIDQEFSYEMEQQKVDPLSIEKNNAIIALVGDNMKSHQGISGKMFSALGRNNVNVRAIAQGSSEKNISAVINKYDAKKALNTLHEQFFEEKTKIANKTKS